MKEEIIPVQPVRRIKEVRPVRPVKLYRRLRYRSKLKENLPRFLRKTVVKSQAPVEPADNSQNKAHQNPEHIGEHIDFKT